MTDTVIKGNGKSRKMKAPSDMPDTYEQWRAKMLSGDAYIDMSLNGDGCDVVGTPLSKDTLLKDATATKLGLSSTEKTVDAAINKLFTYASDGKTKVAAAVTGKGVNTPSSATFDQIAANIGKITTEQTPEISVSNTGLITATCGSKSATQQLPTQGARTIVPSITPVTISAGKYTIGDITINGDPNLIVGNIKAGVSIFGVPGTMQPLPKYRVLYNGEDSISCSLASGGDFKRRFRVPIYLDGDTISHLYSFSQTYRFRSNNVAWALTVVGVSPWDPAQNVHLQPVNTGLIATIQCIEPHSSMDTVECTFVEYLIRGNGTSLFVNVYVDGYNFETGTLSPVDSDVIPSGFIFYD